MIRCQFGKRCRRVAFRSPAQRVIVLVSVKAARLPCIHHGAALVRE